MKVRRYTKAEALAWLAGEQNPAGQHDAAVCALTVGASWDEVAAAVGVGVSAVKRRYASDSRLPRSLRA